MALNTNFDTYMSIYPTFIYVDITDTQYTHLTGDKYTFIKGHNKPRIAYELVAAPYGMGMSAAGEYVYPRPAQGIQAVDIGIGTNEYSIPTVTAGEQPFCNYTHPNYPDGWVAIYPFEPDPTYTYDRAQALLDNANIVNIQDPKVTLRVKDYRYREGSYVTYLNILDYHDVVVYGNAVPITPAGVGEFNYFGLYFPDFGATKNTIKLSYQCYDQDGNLVAESNKDFVPDTIADSGHFEGIIRISGLDYTTSYSIEIIAKDEVTTSTAVLSSSGDPLFHWDYNDFEFNIPVRIRNGLQLGENAAIYGGAPTESGSKEIMALRGSDLYLGYSSYADEYGTTYLYGNDIQFNYTIDGGGSFSVKQMTGLINCLSNSYTLDTDVRAVTTIDSYNPNDDQYYEAVLHDLVPSCSCTLRGNSLFIRFYCKGLNTWNIGSGDIADQCLGTVRIYHNGMITGAEAVAGSAGTSGVTCGLMMKDLYVDEEMVAFQPYICNSTGPMDAVLTTFVVPVTLDLSKFA